ncbi:tail fiber domain-containing protein [Rhizobium giardinii]|uniref:tail fiber domain-containing protein n=1 Tax=Rhizobium giardinii TaxID=56731 RepID=UPI0039DFDDC8
MAKDKIADYDASAAGNTDIGGIGIQGSNLPSNFDNAFREIMSQLKEADAGTSPLTDTWSFCDPADRTKIFRFDAGSITTGTTRVCTMPNSNFTIGSTSGGNVPFMSGANTWSAIQTYATADGSAGDVWGGRLLVLQNFAPGIFFSDSTVSAYNALMGIDGSSFTIKATNQTDGTGLANVLSISLNGTYVLTYGDLGSSVFAGSSPNFTVSTSAGYHLANNGLILASRSGANALNLQRTASDGSLAAFFRQTTQVGSISVTASATAYNTSSDHRLKSHVSTLQSSGAFIDALRPVEFVWDATGEKATGFIAHEFQSVSPSSVTGEKDAVDDDGNPEYQTMQASSSEVMANIICELQSLRRRVSELEKG